MPGQRIVCVLSNPRSGSTALRSALAAGGVLQDFGEIFHDDRTLTRFPFLDYLERWPDPLNTILNYDGCAEIARAYLRQLNFEAQGRRALIDVKHNAWSVLRPLWQYPHDTPLFFSALKAQQAIFIQLKRQNLADQVISYHLAMQTNIWHAQQSAADVAHISGKRFEPVLAHKLCSFFAQAEALVEGFCAGYPHCITLNYETIFFNDVLTPATAAQLSTALGTSIPSTALPFKKNQLDNRQIISNYAQICEIAEQVQAAYRHG